MTNPYDNLVVAEDFDDDDVPHISDLDPNQILFVEESDGSLREATVSELLAAEEAEEIEATQYEN